MVADTNTVNGESSARKRPVRSRLLFPAYGFNAAFQIAKTVEMDGNGSLTEESLAIALELSVKSSGFKLKTLTARQFGLLTKSGTIISTTPLTKAMVRPTRPGEDVEARVQSFLNIPLFEAVAQKYRGSTMPASDVLRNILVRQFDVDPTRAAPAERVLLDSAREAGLLIDQGGKQYLSLDANVLAQRGAHTPIENPPPPGNGGAAGETPLSNPPVVQDAGQQSGSILVSELDMATLDRAEFDQVWTALGTIFRARGERQLRERDAERQPTLNESAADVDLYEDDV